MIAFAPYVVSIIVAVLMSSGFWLLVQRRVEKKDNRTKLLLGLCHDRIFYLGTTYIKRGWITRDELDNLHKYLSTPYYALGGNGVVKSIVDECLKLQIKRVQDLTPEDLAALVGK